MMLRNINLDFQYTLHLPSRKSFDGLLTAKNALLLSAIAATYASVQFVQPPKGLWLSGTIALIGAGAAFSEEVKKIGAYVLKLFRAPSSENSVWERFRDPTVPPRNPPPVPPRHVDLSQSSFIVLATEPQPVETMYLPGSDWIILFYQE